MAPKQRLGACKWAIERDTEEYEYLEMDELKRQVMSFKSGGESRCRLIVGFYSQLVFRIVACVKNLAASLVYDVVGRIYVW